VFIELRQDVEIDSADVTLVILDFFITQDFCLQQMWSNGTYLWYCNYTSLAQQLDTKGQCVSLWHVGALGRLIILAPSSNPYSSKFL